MNGQQWPWQDVVIRALALLRAEPSFGKKTKCGDEDTRDTMLVAAKSSYASVESPTSIPMLPR